ncbi:hypothetical protein [Pyxidicoccus xibeiensis]|uniref:hypothetical protein n=1 Tax=Pyxidicoccus xibeiensis TaxID=2906759 RepID=UPI0020A7ACA3|nr:hypothetical protein [Pyxidicoccus xibeiensis]MCP3139356.1 hypothetical protein [Pyxidicoccus xibeiensis]
MRWRDLAVGLGLAFSVVACGDMTKEVPEHLLPLGSLTGGECSARGGEALMDPGDGSMVAAGRCPDGRQTLGYIDCCEGGFCCEEGGLCGKP